MLKMTTIELELIPEPDIYIFFEKDPRGGFLVVPIDVPKSKVNIQIFITQNDNENILYT